MLRQSSSEENSVNKVVYFRSTAHVPQGGGIRCYLDFGISILAFWTFEILNNVNARSHSDVGVRRLCRLEWGGHKRPIKEPFLAPLSQYTQFTRIWSKRGVRLGWAETLLGQVSWRHLVIDTCFDLENTFQGFWALNIKMAKLAKIGP